MRRCTSRCGSGLLCGRPDFKVWLPLASCGVVSFAAATGGDGRACDSGSRRQSTERPTWRACVPVPCACVVVGMWKKALRCEGLRREEVGPRVLCSDGEHGEQRPDAAQAFGVRCGGAAASRACGCTGAPAEAFLPVAGHTHAPQTAAECLLTPACAHVDANVRHGSGSTGRGRRGSAPGCMLAATPASSGEQPSSQHRRARSTHIAPTAAREAWRRLAAQPWGQLAATDNPCERLYSVLLAAAGVTSGRKAARRRLRAAERGP